MTCPLACLYRALLPCLLSCPPVVPSLHAPAMPHAPLSVITVLTVITAITVITDITVLTVITIITVITVINQMSSSSSSRCVIHARIHARTCNDTATHLHACCAHDGGTNFSPTLQSWGSAICAGPQANRKPVHLRFIFPTPCR